MVKQTLGKEQLVLAIDQGGQSSRVAVYNTRGEQVCCFHAPCITTTSNAGGRDVHVEQDGAEILAGIRVALVQVEAFLGEQCRAITAGGFAGQGSSLLCWHKCTGVALSPVLSWQDRRAEYLLEDFPFTQKEVQQSTGLRISPHYGASKMRWCLDHLTDVQMAEQADELCIGPIASYLFWHLLKQENSQLAKSQIDPGHAQRSLLWNLHTNSWDQNLLSAFNIPQKILPSCRWHNSHFGTLTLGDSAIPFATSQRDQGASLFARGMPQPDACYINIGTGAFMQRISTRLVAPEGLLVSPLWLPERAAGIHPPAQNFYVWEATVNGAAAAISWLENDIGSTLTPEQINNALMSDHSAVNSNFYLLNAVGGLSAPYWRTDLTSRFSDDLVAPLKIQAWIESVIFQLMVNFELMQSLGSAHSIYISGGLSRADGLCQRLSDLSKVKVHRSDNTDASLQGVAYTAAGMPQTWQPTQGDEIFQPQSNPLLQRRFTQWQAAMNDWLRNKN